MVLDRRPVRRFFLGAVALFLAIALLPAPALAKKESPRLGQYDAYVFVERLGQGTANDEIYPAVTYTEDSALLYGAGFGKTVHTNLNVGAELYYGKPDAIATVAHSDFSRTQPLRMIGGNVFLDCFLADWYITPLITGGMGLVHYYSDQFGGPNVIPFNPAADTARKTGFSDLNFTYNLGGGLRWDINKRFMVKGLFQQTWRQLGGTVGPLTIQGYKLEAGMKF